MATDWSKTGLCHTLLQKYCRCEDIKPNCCDIGWRVCLVGSRFTNPAEANYAPIEGEALAVADGLEKTRYFTLGCKDLIVAVDHKPLLKILGDRKLEDIPNERLLRLKERTLRWKFTVVHIPGKHHKVADAGSRYPSGHAEVQRMDADEPQLFGFKEKSETGMALNALYDEEELEMIIERTEEE